MMAPAFLDNARLPRWLLPADWPQQGGVPVLARIELEAGRVQSVRPASDGIAPSSRGTGTSPARWCSPVLSMRTRTSTRRSRCRA